jgi:hypothetical protein
MYRLAKSRHALHTYTQIISRLRRIRPVTVSAGLMELARNRWRAAGRRQVAREREHTALGDPDLRTVYLGSLMGQTLPSFRSPVPGRPMAHWHRHA